MKKNTMTSFKSYKKNNKANFFMDIKKLFCSSNNEKFYSSEMIISKKSLNENQLRYTYQKRLISDLDSKHKEWSRFLKANY